MKSRSRKWHLLFLAITLVVVFSAPAFARAGGGGGGGKGVGGSIGLIFGVLYLIYYAFWRLYIIYRKSWINRALYRFAIYDPKWNPETLAERVEVIYFAVQNAWGRGDMEDARKHLTNQSFEDLQKRLVAMRTSGKRNILEEIDLLNVEIIGYSDSNNDYSDKAYVLIKGEMVDYNVRINVFVPDQPSEEELKKRTFWEIWELGYTKNGWCLSEIMEGKGFSEILALPVECHDQRYCPVPVYRRSR